MPTLNARVEHIAPVEPGGEFGRHVVVSLAQPAPGGFLAVPPMVLPAMTAAALFGAVPVVGDTYAITVEPTGSGPPAGL